MDSIICGFCDSRVSREYAIEHDWTPSFYLDEAIESDRSACPRCACRHLIDVDGEPTVRPVHHADLRPTMAVLAYFARRAYRTFLALGPVAEEFHGQMDNLGSVLTEMGLDPLPTTAGTSPSGENIVS